MNCEPSHPHSKSQTHNKSEGHAVSQLKPICAQWAQALRGQGSRWCGLGVLDAVNMHMVAD